MDIAGGDHSSQKILHKPKGVVPELPSQRTARGSVRSSGSNMSHVVDHLKTFNSKMRDDLDVLKNYLHDTNQRLETIASHRSRRSTARTRRSRTSLDDVVPERELYSRSTTRSRILTNSSTRRHSPASIIQEARDEADYNAIPTRRSIKGYRIGHDVEMVKHQSGFTFPVFGAGAVTESKTARHQNMVKRVEKNPVAPEAASHATPFLNNMYLDDPSYGSGGWRPMFRLGNATFINKHDCQIPCHPV